MGKTNFRRMMMLRDHDKNREPERDRLEEERDRRNVRWNAVCASWKAATTAIPTSRKERPLHAYLPYPRYPDVENGRRMPQIGFSQNGDWDKRSGQYERGGADSRSIRMPRQHLTHDEAEEWCDSMVNADGTKGCHWTLEQTQDVAKQRNITCEPNDFWAVMNMMYSDYCQVAKRQSVDTPGFYADMAKAFLEDADAADGKAYLYWDCIADK